ncbi:MAG: hypothetical protein ACRDFZ_05625 [Candidatus Limnocylindria bacterium]
MFRRGKASAKSAADAAERQALFEKLAQRPENVCPFLGLADSRSDYQDQATDDHRCYAFGEPEPISGEQQRNVCLQRGYANCPRYLRGVLVIPTDELEALRRVPQRVPPPPPPSAKPMPAPTSRSGGRRRGVAVMLVLLLLIGGGAGTWWVLAGPGAVALETPSPLPSPTSEPSPSQSEAEPSFPVTPSPGPTPAPGDVFIGYEVTVLAGSNDIFRVSEAGEITEESHVFFSRFSQAPVDRVEAPNSLLHWRVTAGEVTGWSYIRPDSGPFLIREVYRAPDGSLRYIVLDQDET